MAYWLSPLAEADLEDIWLYTADRWSVAQADSYHADIVDAMDRLDAGQRRGRPVDIREGYLKYAVGQHFVFFRPTDAGFDVIRILHQNMDVERHL